MSDTQARLIEILRRRGAYCGDCDFRDPTPRGWCRMILEVLNRWQRDGDGDWTEVPVVARYVNAADLFDTKDGDTDAR